jgi:hypothetical protein
MPLHIDIRLDERIISTLHIQRVEERISKHGTNSYLILEGDEPLRYEDWLIDGIPFTHRYSDGAEICVMKGIQAMRGFAGGPVGKEVW